MKPKGAAPLFASAIRVSKIEVSFEHRGQTHQVTLDLPAEVTGIKRGRFTSGAVTGEYETRHLPQGGSFYHLLIDKTGATQLPNGQAIAFREGVMGFRNESRGVSFQASTGRRIATGAPIHAPPEELFRIGARLYSLGTGLPNPTGDLEDLCTFLSDETDLGLLQATLDFLLDPKFRNGAEGNWRAEKVIPVLANPYLDRATQKAILVSLVESAGSGLLSEKFYRIRSINRTLAAQEAIFELALELTGPAYQKHPSLDTPQREMAFVRGLELLAFLSPVKAGPSLPDADLLKAVDLALEASTSRDPMRRLAATKSLPEMVPTMRPDFDRQAASRLMTRIRSREWSGLVEKVEAQAEARVAFLTRFLGNGKTLSLTDADEDTLYNSLAVQLETGVVTTAVALAAMGAIEMLPFNETPFRPSQGSFVRSFTRRMKGLPIRDDVGGLPVRIRDDLASRMTGLAFGYSEVSVPRGRVNLYRLVTEEDPTWTEKLSAGVAMDLRTRFSPTDQPLGLADLERWLVKDRRVLVSLAVSEDPPGGLVEAVRRQEWNPAERGKVLERLLNEAAAHLWHPISSDNWVDLAYRYASRYDMKGEFYRWIDAQWERTREPRLIIATARGMDGAGRDPEVRSRLVRYAREMVGSGRGSVPGQVEVLRSLTLRGIGKITDDERFLAGKFLEALLDRSTLPKSDGDEGYSLSERVYDLRSLQVMGHLPRERWGRAADFFARAFGDEPTPDGLFSSASEFRQAAQGVGLRTPKLDAALKEFSYLGHVPAHATMTGQQFFDTVTGSPDREARIRAAEEGKFIVLNRRFIRERMAGKPFNPNDVQSLQLLETGLGIAMHDHSGTVAEEAERSYAYALTVLAPPSEGEGEVQPLLIVRDGKRMARPNKKSDWRVFALDVSGTISTESMAAAREALTALPRQHTARFLGVEGHMRDPQRHSAGLREMVHPEGGHGVGRPTRYTMQIYENLDLATAVHAVMHPIWDFLSWEDQRSYEALHKSSRDPLDFAEPYGMTDAMEDFTTLGTAWARDSEKMLKTAVDSALKGRPIILQKLLIFLSAYSEGHSKLPAHKFEGDSYDPRIRNSELAYEKLPMAEITAVTIGSITYRFAYEGRRLKSVNGQNL